MPFDFIRSKVGLNHRLRSAFTPLRGSMTGLYAATFRPESVQPRRVRGFITAALSRSALRSGR